MEQVTLHRWRKPLPLVFTGDVIAEATSEGDGNARWTELRIWRTDTGRYVIEEVAVSTVPGETNRVFAKVVDADGVVDALHRESRGKRFITDLALQVLEHASQADPAIVVAEQV